MNIRLYAVVRNSLWFLYEKLSGIIHFNAGEEFPIKIVPFAVEADTLAFITFLNHYKIPMYLAPTYLITALNSTKVKEQIQPLNTNT